MAIRGPSPESVRQGASTRRIAIDCLYRVIHQEHRADATLDNVFTRNQLNQPDRAFVHEVVYGTLRHFYSLEADVSRFLKEKPPDWLRMALFAGAYQLRHMRVPAHAAVAETVAASKDSPFHFASGMVNAVLRRVSDTPPPAKLKPYQRAELPRWLYARWRDAFGPDAVLSFSRVLQTPPPLALALLTDDRQSWMHEAAALGVEAREGALSPHAVILPAGGDIDRLPGFDAGTFVVMDEAAQLAAEIISGIRGHIADLCAAPGGKALVLARNNPQAHTSAIELSAVRLSRLLQNMKRIRAGNISALQADAARLPMTDASIDAVLLDAPCSASGILRRHPDAKFLHGAHSIGRHAGQQKMLLAEGLRVLKPGGSLVYAVCSIHAEENEQVVASMSGWEAGPLPGVLDPFRIDDGMARLLPTAGHDGFFIAHLRKC